MARPLDICIRGDGIVGHVLALALARERLRVGLVVAPAHGDKSHPDVRAYALNDQSRAMLQGLRCWPEADQATPVLAMQVKEGASGVVNFDASAQGASALAWIVDVPALEARLAEAVRFQAGIELLTGAQPAQLTVVCDGRASPVRESLGVELDATPYGQWAIAARVDCAVAHAQTACQWFTPHDILAFLPLGGSFGNSMAIVWSVSHDRHEELMAMEPDLFSRQLELASGHRFGALTLHTPRAAWRLQLATARRWCGVHGGQSWVLAGDAAHVVHPLAGQGLNLGIADVAELVRQIVGRDYWRNLNDEKLLRRYERSRKTSVRLMGSVTDGLQQLFSRPGAAWASVRSIGMGGFESSGSVKRWVARQAMGTAAPKAR